MSYHYEEKEHKNNFGNDPFIILKAALMNTFPLDTAGFKKGDIFNQNQFIPKESAIRASARGSRINLCKCSRVQQAVLTELTFDVTEMQRVQNRGNYCG